MAFNFSVVVDIVSVIAHRAMSIANIIQLKVNAYSFRPEAAFLHVLSTKACV